MFRFHKEGNISIGLGLTIIIVLNALIFGFLHTSFILQIILSASSVLFFIFILQFFRNPIRMLPLLDDSLVYAPADGKIVVIEETKDKAFLDGKKCLQVSIFMSPLNVHVNRNPISGTIIHSQYHPGKYLMAWNPKSSTENERTTIIYQRADGMQVLMRQVAGFLARRIVNYLHAGDYVKQGKDMGFIKLGSRVDLLLPLDANIMVKIGDIVKGNQNVIAKISQNIAAEAE